MFVDKLVEKIDLTSPLILGIDPRKEAIPKYVLPDGCYSHEALSRAIVQLYGSAIESLKDKICAVKPNIAFFEQFGVAGLQAFQEICNMAHSKGILVIGDVKRGDIGSTAESYARAYLAGDSPFNTDAITVNPFLGRDTLQPFIRACKKSGKGLFILVLTSNEGAHVIQGATVIRGERNRVCDVIAGWIDEAKMECMGESGYSSIGAVVGATQSEDVEILRDIMPDSFFLMPGLGAQGADPKVFSKAVNRRGGGVIVNVSRGIMGDIPADISEDDFVTLISHRADDFISQIRSALEDIV